MAMPHAVDSIVGRSLAHGVTAQLNEVDEREARGSKQCYRCIRPDIHPRRRFVLALSKISTRRHRTRRECIRIYHPTLSRFAHHHISRRRSSASVSSQERLGLCTRGRRWEIGRCERISAAEDGGCEGVAETMGFFDR